MTEMVRNIDMDMLYWGDKNVSQLKEIKFGRRKIGSRRSTTEMVGERNTEYRMDSRIGVYEDERGKEEADKVNVT